MPKKKVTHKDDSKTKPVLPCDVKAEKLRLWNEVNDLYYEVIVAAIEEVIWKNSSGREFEKNQRGETKVTVRPKEIAQLIVKDIISALKIVPRKR